MTMEITSFFDELKSQKTLLSTCVDLYKTLTSHITSLDQAITSKSQILDSKLQDLDSDFQKTFESLQNREESIPDRLSSLSSLVESQNQAAIEEFQKPPPSGNDATFSEELKSLCRKMDAERVLNLVVSRRKESSAFRSDVMNAIAESVDPPRLVLDVVAEYVQQKADGKSGMTDKRWVCGVMVGGMFKVDELKKGNLGFRSSGTLAQRAEVLLKDWREKVEKADAEGLIGMQPADASMFLQIVLGFGLKDKFEEEFYKKLVLEFSGRRDMTKLAVPLFGEKVGDIIDELVKKGKEVEAVYFASESGLTEKFKPTSMLKSYLQKAEKDAVAIRKKGNHSPSAKAEAKNLEMESIKSIIKCVQDVRMEAKFPLESLRKRLTSMEKGNTDKKASAVGSKPLNKRGPSGGGSRVGGPRPPPRPAKIPRFSGSYPPPPFGERNPLSPAQHSVVSRYPGPHNYPSQDMGLNAASYGPTYTGSYVPGSAQITPQQYATVGDSHGSGVAPVPVSYGGQVGGYGSYDYGATTNLSQAYQPSSYTQ